MKIVAIVVLSLMLVFIGARVYDFWSEEHQLNSQLADIQARLTKAQTDEANMQADVQYLANPMNLEKEIRSRFNYIKPGETMMVIVPAATTTGE